MFTSRSIDIGVVWPSFEGTWRQWAPKKLLQLLAYAAVCGLIVLLILWLSKEGLHFLANFLKLKYFECSNPIEKKVFKTHLFLTTGKLLNATGFQLGKFTELDSSLPRDKVTVTPAGLGHTLFKIEGVSAGILVENSPRLNEQRQILEYLAHNPAACYAKEIQEFRGKYWPDEVHEFRGRYCPIEEYSDLLSSKALYVCRFPQNAAVFGKLERDLGLFSWVGSSERFEKLGRALRFTSRWLFWFARHTGLYSPLESVPLYQKNLYLYGFLGFGLKISLRKYTPGDGVVML